VLSGAAMSVVRDRHELAELLAKAAATSPDYPVVLSKFIEGAFEVDVDAVASEGTLVAYAISEHLERGGVHSGDATLILPSFRLSDYAKEKMKADCARIAGELNVCGPFNTQFLIAPATDASGAADDWVGVIETNLRASRSVPFVSKVLDVDFIQRATQCTVGTDPGVMDPKCERTPATTGVKSPQFSFARLLGADPILGVEMHSTGEVACFGDTFEEAYLKSLISTRDMRLPAKGSGILVCARRDAPGSLAGAVYGVRMLADQGFRLFAADGESEAVLRTMGILSHVTDAHVAVAKRGVSLVLDLSNNHEDFYTTRRASADFSIPLITNHEQTLFFAQALGKRVELSVKSYDEHIPVLDDHATAQAADVAAEASAEEVASLDAPLATTTEGVMPEMGTLRRGSNPRLVPTRRRKALISRASRWIDSPQSYIGQAPFVTKIEPTTFPVSPPPRPTASNRRNVTFDPASVAPPSPPPPQA